MNDVFHSIDVTESVPDKNGDSDEEIAAVDADDTNLFLAVERNPPVQCGLNGQNLDKVYNGHLPSQYGTALRKWIFGVNGLAFEMIMPAKHTKEGRKCASKESMLTFFREILQIF